MKVGADGFQDELERGSPLKLAGGRHGPEALTGGASAGVARACVTTRSMTTKRRACSAALLVGSRPGVVMKRKKASPCLRMNDLKQSAQRGQQAGAVGLGPGIGQREEKLDVTDQVGQAELNTDVEVVHVLAISREVITAEHAVELAAQHLNQHLGTVGGVDLTTGHTGRPGRPKSRSAGRFPWGMRGRNEGTG